MAAAAMVVAAFFAGQLSGSFAFAAPALIAVLVGLLLGHALAPTAAILGHRMLARGRALGGLGLLQVARRPATARVVALLTVATALLVFSFDTLAVGARNRTSAAEQQLGAPLVATVNGDDVTAVRTALHSADPSGRRVTPVIRLRSPSQDLDTVGVEPDGFRQVGYFPGQDARTIPFQRLALPDAPAIRLVGTKFTGRLTTTKNTKASDPDKLGTLPQLSLLINGSDGLRTTQLVSSLPSGAIHRRFSIPMSCEKGCDLAGLDISTDPGVEGSGTFRLSNLHMNGGRPVDLGRGWRLVDVPPTDPDQLPGKMLPRPIPGGLSVNYSTAGFPDLQMLNDWAPTTLPALTTPSIGRGTAAEPITGIGLDGASVDLHRVGGIDRVPSAVRASTVVNLNMLVRQGVALDPSYPIEVWFSRDDPALLAKVRASLHQHHMALSQVRTIAQTRRELNQSAAGWSARLATVIGAAGLLLGALMLILVAAASWRRRAADLAALRMGGFATRSLFRIGLAEQLAISLAVVLGAVCGVVGAHYSLPTVPLFASTPAVSTVDLSTAWPAVLITFVIALVVLGTVGVLTEAWIARRAVVDRVRDAV